MSCLRRIACATETWIATQRARKLSMTLSNPMLMGYMAHVRVIFFDLNLRDDEMMMHTDILLIVPIVFSSMLVPILLALMYFSTSHQRQTPLFICVVLTVAFSIAQCITHAVYQVFDICLLCTRDIYADNTCSCETS
jgi:hypothetical protein